MFFVVSPGHSFLRNAVVPHRRQIQELPFLHWDIHGQRGAKVREVREAVAVDIANIEGDPRHWCRILGQNHGKNGGFSGFGWENHGKDHLHPNSWWFFGGSDYSSYQHMVYNRFWICPCQNSDLFDASFLPYALWSSSHVGMEEKKTWIHQPALMHRNSDCNKALVGPVVHLMRQDQPQPHLRVDIGRYHILCKFVYLYWWAYYSV